MNCESLCWKIYSFFAGALFWLPWTVLRFFPPATPSHIPFSTSLINRLSTVGLSLYEMYFLGLKSPLKAGFAIHNVKAAQMCPGDLMENLSISCQ